MSGYCDNCIDIVLQLTNAEIYGKQHKHVMEKIRSFIDLIPEINGLNFKLVNYEDNKGEKRPMYIIDRQGFSMLVNKFTGDEATIFTYKYTQAFECLIELVKQLQEVILNQVVDGLNATYIVSLASLSI